MFGSAGMLVCMIVLAVMAEVGTEATHHVMACLLLHLLYFFLYRLAGDELAVGRGAGTSLRSWTGECSRHRRQLAVKLDHRVLQPTNAVDHHMADLHILWRVVSSIVSSCYRRLHIGLTRLHSNFLMLPILYGFSTPKQAPAPSRNSTCSSSLPPRPAGPGSLSCGSHADSRIGMTVMGGLRRVRRWELARRAYWRLAVRGRVVGVIWRVRRGGEGREGCTVDVCESDDREG